MTNVAQPFGVLTLAGAGAYTQQDFYKQRAAALIGSTSGFQFFDDFLIGNLTTPNGWVAAPLGTGSGNLLAPNNKDGGIWQIATGATAASQGGGGVQGGQQLTTESAPWYAAMRFQLTTAVIAADKFALYLVDSGSANTIGLGYDGSLNGGTVFNVQHSGAKAGTGLSTGKAVDTNVWHVIEAWGNGAGSINCCIDLGAIATGAITVAQTQFQTLNCLITNTGDAVNRAANVDWVLCAGTRAP